IGKTLTQSGTKYVLYIWNRYCIGYLQMMDLQEKEQKKNFDSDSWTCASTFIVLIPGMQNLWAVTRSCTYYLEMTFLIRAYVYTHYILLYIHFSFPRQFKQILFTKHIMHREVGGPNVGIDHDWDLELVGP
ncbi:hypothetical protein ACJX0J_020764, partial [Zea mays]